MFFFLGIYRKVTEVVGVSEDFGVSNFGYMF